MSIYMYYINVTGTPEEFHLMSTQASMHINYVTTITVADNFRGVQFLQLVYLHGCMTS